MSDVSHDAGHLLPKQPFILGSDRFAGLFLYRKRRWREVNGARSSPKVNHRADSGHSFRFLDLLLFVPESLLNLQRRPNELLPILGGRRASS